MDPEYLVVLYSKYSPQCQKILEIYDSDTMDYIKMVCVDNSKFRERLSISKSLQVKTVPCVLLMYPGNRIEKFEGSNVTEWLIQQISQNLPTTESRRTELPEDNMAVQPPQPQRQQQSPQPQPPQPQQQFTAIEDLAPAEDMSQEQQNQQHTLSETIRQEKSVAEVAAEMAAEREKADQPAHVQMQKMGQQALSQIP